MSYIESSELRAESDPTPEQLITDGLAVIGAEIHPEESMAYGVSDSAHHVFFGSKSGVEIAIKPFWGLEGSHRAFHEEQMLYAARERERHQEP